VSGSLPAVLVTSGGGFQGLALVRLLSESDAFRVVVADSHAEGATSSLADAFLQVPPVSEDEKLLRALCEVCRGQDVRLILLATDHELELLARAEPDLRSAGARVAVCPPALLAELRDKRRLYAMLAAAGLPVLSAVDPRESGLPLIGKLRHGWGSRGLLVAQRTGDIEALSADDLERRVWQPYLPDVRELSADFAIGFDGNPSPIGLRWRVRVSGGFAVISRTAHEPDAEAIVARFAALAAQRGGCGLFNVQLLLAEQGFVVSDVNPRLGTSAVHWRGSGFNPVLFMCAQAGLLEPPAAVVPPSRKTVRCLEETVHPGEDRPQVAGIVFDLDDTLVPAKRFQLARLERALSALVRGWDLERALREACRLIEEGPRDRLIDAVATALGWPEPGRLRLLEAYRSAWPATCPTYPDVRPALDGLRRAGLRTAVLTDNPPDTQRRKLESAGLLPFFDCIVYTREAGGEKPHPVGFACVARAIRLPPERLAMAGDNPHRDLAGAAEAGFARLFWVRRSGASCGFDPALVERLPGCDRYEAVPDLRELAARLRRG
jgi:FMN phosphatase YigB (HAD superfamily)/carbamoylphosphate synthase large subunit